MGFMMDGLDAEEYDRTYSDRALVSRILTYFRPHAGIMVFVSAMLFLNSIMETALPFLTSRGVDQLTEGFEITSALPLVGAILIAGILAWTFNYIRQQMTASVVAKVVYKLRQDAFTAVMARDMSFYDEFPSGSIVSRVTSDSQEFSNTVTLTLNLVSQLLQVVLLFGLLFFIDTLLAWITVAICPLVIFAALAFRHIARNVSTQVRRILGELNATIQETVAGISVAKNFNQEKSIYETFKKVNKSSYYLGLKQGIVFAGIFPVLFSLAGLATAVVLYFGGDSAFSGRISAGEFYLFVLSIEIFWFPLTSIASFWSQLQLGMAAAERVFALVDAEPRVVQNNSIHVKQLKGHISFENVTFRYSEKEQVLNGFSLDIRPGETVALVGHTGAGKSSVTKLVARFYEFQSGRIKVDGVDIRDFDMYSYHRQLGMVSQIPFLFSGTVRDNIRYGTPDAGDEELERVANSIGHGLWMEALPQGLDTDVGEAGRSLSLGQRQLVALARLLLQEPSVIILDEATASVDPLTETQIQEGLEQVLADRSAIVIAHRLSTIQAADRIIVMQDGLILEEGTHDSLMESGGHYAELYATYFRHHSLDYQLV